MILTLGQAPVESLLDASNGTVDVSQNIHWTNWYNLIFGVLINVGPQLRAKAVLDFPNTLAQSSSDLTIAAPGTTPNMQVSLGAPLPPAGSQFTAYAGIDLVTVRFSNFSAAPINPPSGEFRIAVHTGEET